MSVDTWCSFTDVRRESDLRHVSPALTHLQLGHASPDLCMSCGASQSRAESQRLGVGDLAWSGPAEGHSVSSPALRARGPVQSTLFYSLSLCPALPWVGAKKQLQVSDPGPGGEPQVGAGL